MSSTWSWGLTDHIPTFLSPRVHGVWYSRTFLFQGSCSYLMVSSHYTHAGNVFILSNFLQSPRIPLGSKMCRAQTRLLGYSPNWVGCHSFSWNGQEKKGSGQRAAQRFLCPHAPPLPSQHMKADSSKRQFHQVLSLEKDGRWGHESLMCSTSVTMTKSRII